MAWTDGQVEYRIHTKTWTIGMSMKPLKFKDVRQTIVSIVRSSAGDKATISERGRLGEWLGTNEVVDRQNLVERLFDRSISGWFVSLIYDTYYTGRLTVNVKRSGDHSTNIDADFIEAILEGLEKENG